MSNSDYSNVHPSLKSGLTGGAATGHGVEYQTWYAVYVALKLISRFLREIPIPNEPPMLVIEPRILTGQSLTRWDIRTAPDNVAIEAKAKPAKGDLIELLKRCRDNVDSGSNQQFELVYGKCSIGFLHAIEKLIRLAIESAGKKDAFDKLCELESDDGLQEVLRTLGSAALPVGRRLTLKPMPDHILHDVIDLHLEFLCPPSHRERVKDALCSKLVRGMKSREAFFIRMFLIELRDSGCQFVDGGAILPTHIDPALHKAVFLLQRCDAGLPIEVLAQLTDCPSDELQQKFQQSQAAAVNPTGLCRSSPLLARLDHPDAPQLLAAALTGIVEYIKANKTNLEGLHQVDSAIVLVRECHAMNPAAATTAFDPLDKVLKRSGQKRRVLEMADITVNAARSVSTPTESVRKAEAKALICGFAWVYQRTGRFEEAETVAADSLRIGEDLGWIRNTAFCLKCTGRLRRVRAEQEQHARRITKLLNESRELLLKAIDAFWSCDELTPAQRQEEVGDCFSLLGRTHLLAGRTHDADQCATESRTLMTSLPGFATSKDYMDLLILEGDLLARQFDYSKADAKFAAALDCLDPMDAEKSEMAARAYLALGVNRFRWKQDKDGAVEEVRKAARIWEKLDEHFYRGLAEWTIIEIMGGVLKRERNRLKMVSPPVRVEMVRLIRLQQRTQSTKTLSQRAELNDAAWNHLLADAKKNDAIRHRRW
jgi:tetratricopeptide (TPR) repeat protein